MVREGYSGWPRGRRRGARGAGARRWRRGCSSCRSSSSGGSAWRTSARPSRTASTYHPTCHSLRLLRVGDAPLRLLRAVRGLELVELPDAERVLRLRRHLRGQERRHLDGDARPTSCGAILDTGAEVCTAADNSCLMHIGGGLSPRARGRARHAPGRDPGQRGRVKDGFPGRGARARCADSSCARNLGHATTTIRDKRARVVGRGARLGGAARRGRGDQGRARCAHLDVHLERLEAAVAARRRAPCTGRATPPRRTRSSPTSPAPTARRGRQGQVAGHRRDRPQRRRSRAVGVHARRDRPRRADHPARRRQVLAHPRAGDPPQPRARSATSSGARSLGRRGLRRPARARRGGARCTCARSSSRRRSASAARTSRVAETGHGGASSSRRATGACARRCPRCSSPWSGIEKLAAALARPRGVPAAAAALVDRRAHEPLHVALDRRAPTATGRASSTSSCSTTAARDVLADEVGRAGAALHPLLGVPERLPGLRAHRRPRLRLASTRGRSARSSRRSCRASRTRRRCRARQLLCGACYEVCPVKIDIPSVLVHLRGRVVREVRRAGARARGDGGDGAGLRQPPRATRPRSGSAKLGRGAAGRRGRCGRGRARASCPSVPGQTFRDWWRDCAPRELPPRGRRVSARAEILARVRAALRDVPAGEAPRAYRRAAAARRRRRGRALRRARGGLPRRPCARPTPLADDRRAGVRRARRAPARRAARAARGLAARRRRARRGRRPQRARARRARRRAHRLRAGHRRDRHDRPRRRRALRAGAR